MTKRIEIKYIDTESMELSYSQPKGSYSKEKIISKLDEYEKEMFK